MFTSSSRGDDIFSTSDQGLADTFKFVEEIGFGNWGSVWLCETRQPPPRQDEFEDEQDADNRLAVKIVHRNKTPTTSARVRSLWNEMKIIRLLKYDQHPSIITFFNFIITPSYALVSMQYLPRLIPVEVPEPKAKEWCRSLVSAIDFLHKRGIVHNDIKPANIMLSSAVPPVPVLVDFGFAEKYDTGAKKAFISNLAYGTPEYLSPERARGLLHDTRKADVWSLGVTLFEILVGRTPFEYEEGETFATKEDLERYWTRTLKGKWLGEWFISRPLEKLLKKMISPNADMRCTARQALYDPYFVGDDALHEGDTSFITSEHAGEITRIMDMSLPWSSPTISSATRKVRTRLSRFSNKENKPTGVRPEETKAQTLGKRIKNKPSERHTYVPTSEEAMNNKINEFGMSKPSHKKTSSVTRKPVPVFDAPDESSYSVGASVEGSFSEVYRRPLGEVTNTNTQKKNRQTPVYLKPKKSRTYAKPEDNPIVTKELPTVPESPASMKLSSDPKPSGSKETKKTPLSKLRHSLKQSFEGGRFHKRSASAADALSDDSMVCNSPPPPPDNRKSWRDFPAVVNASKSSLPAVHQQVRNIQMAAENRLDRMTIWIRSVEETVKDARRDFASGNDVPMPSLPPCPGPVQGKKVGRQIMTADKIFSGSSGRLPKSSMFVLPPLKGSVEESGGPSQYKTAYEAPDSPEMPSCQERPILASLEFSGALDVDGAVTGLDIRGQFTPSAADKALAPEENTTDEYERILLNSSCVMRVGMGFQSNNTAPVGNSNSKAKTVQTRKSGLFNTVRRPASRVFSPDADRRAASMDELGLMKDPSATSPAADGRSTSLNFVQRAVRKVLGTTPVAHRS